MWSLKLDELFRKYSLYKQSFAVPLDFTRFYISFVALRLNETASKLKTIYSSTNTVDYDLYIESIQSILTIHNLIIHLLEKTLSEEDLAIYNSLITKIYNNEVLEVDEVYILKELQVEILVENGLLDVFQLSKPEPVVDVFDEEDGEEVIEEGGDRSEQD